MALISFVALENINHPTIVHMFKIFFQYTYFHFSVYYFVFNLNPFGNYVFNLK